MTPSEWDAFKRHGNIVPLCQRMVPRRESLLSTINTGERLRDALHRAATAFIAAYGRDAYDKELLRIQIRSAASDVQE